MESEITKTMTAVKVAMGAWGWLDSSTLLE
jgi:hypothetical protein